MNLDVFHVSTILPHTNEPILIDVITFVMQAGLLQHMVDKVPDQFLLNTASWRFLIPRLYRKYPNKDMLLNISAISPPSVRINVGRIDTTVDLDVIVNVLGSDDIVPVACISLVSFSSSLILCVPILVVQFMKGNLLE